MPDFTDKETGLHRGPTRPESLRLDFIHAYRTPGASFVYGVGDNTWDISWGEWRTPFHGFYSIGVWMATKMHKGKIVVIAYSTTVGRTGFAQGRGEFDPQPYYSGLPLELRSINSVVMSDKERADLMLAAADNLIKFINLTDTPP